jgi:hypothetical protein
VLVQLERTPEVLVLGPLLGASRPGPSAFDLLHRLLLAALLGVLAWGLLWINATWNTLRLQLRRLSDATWVGAIERLPAQVTRLTRLTPIGAPSAAWVDHALDAAAKARWVRMKEADLERTIAILRGAEQARGEADIARVQGSPRSLAAPASRRGRGCTRPRRASRPRRGPRRPRSSSPCTPSTGWSGWCACCARWPSSSWPR